MAKNLFNIVLTPINFPINFLIYLNIRCNPALQKTGLAILTSLN